MNKENLLRTLEVLQVIDKLLGRLSVIDPYGDILENFAEFPKKYPPVTKRLIRTVKKDLRELEGGGDTK